MTNLGLKLVSLITGLLMMAAVFNFVQPNSPITIILFLVVMAIPFRLLVKATYKFYNEL